ncbi:MAG: hypothetical protein OER88_01865 [Planctomycetota bacterium]|nr:hypothetical protein [Planctomycetota bacterium]
MRLMSVAATALLLVGIALVYYLFFDLRQVHIAALVPDDFSFGVFYSSVDDLREAYEAPYARKDADAGVERVGRPANIPGLEGVAQHRPAGSYWTNRDELVWLVPYTDFGAFEAAFFQSRENTRLRSPQRVSENYLSLSEAALAPRPGKDQTLVRRATEYPIALVGRPDDARSLLRMLSYLFLHEPARKPQGALLLGRQIARLPRAIFEFCAAEWDSLLLGFRRSEVGEPVVVDVEVRTAQGGALSHADGQALGSIVSAAPHSAVAVAAWAMRAEGWSRVGFPLDIGDAAVLAAIIETKHRARPYTLLLVIRSGNEFVVDPLLGSVEPLSYETVDDKGATVKTAALVEVPPRWQHLTRSSARTPPPVYVTTAREKDMWFCAIGAQAHQVVRHALGCARGATELSITRWLRENKHPEAATPDATGMFVIRPEGMKALGTVMPVFEIRSLAAPSAVSGWLRAVDGVVRGDLAIHR